jgi:hypothetical protein
MESMLVGKGPNHFRKVAKFVIVTLPFIACNAYLTIINSHISKFEFDDDTASKVLPRVPYFDWKEEYNVLQRIQKKILEIVCNSLRP